ncbi:Ca2+-transporting ATPase [Daejeonella rubra]|uniref:Ca2+-transporting ATPase n=1 Tax=Daejeonella rubra TaxID=990371 RepID=A0A1G9LRS5_9SPHI|nr:cation-translocating P-type ATPase [Daejeonella rubra]SDL64656.1 Ca2+-transporting ATPase [Daejeonella rubra]
MSKNPFPFTGLSSAEAKKRQKDLVLPGKQQSEFIIILKETVFEPIFILLIASAVVYLLLGEFSEAIFLLSAVILVSTISFFQTFRTRKALSLLEVLTASKTKVIRDGEVLEIFSEEIVPGDFLISEEGSVVAADGLIVHCNDFAVNESVLTGESFSVSKSTAKDNNIVFQGTLAVSGLAVYEVTATGADSRAAQLAKLAKEIKTEKPPLYKQILSFVKSMTIIGMVCFLLVLGFYYFQTQKFLDSLLMALTLAMSILPEEIPVAFTTFMALGAWKLSKTGILVKGLNTVETLGAATVICIDKTGTITENKMELASIYNHQTKEIFNAKQIKEQKTLNEVTEYGMWASEPVPFDPMEIALHDLYKKLTLRDARADFKMIHEYPLDGQPPMMTHIFENKDGERHLATKGAPEAIMNVSDLDVSEKKLINSKIKDLASQGFRVLGVGKTSLKGNSFPEKQQDFSFTFLGLLAFYDPPKENIAKVFDQFYNAGIAVKIITGDNALTTSAIAKQCGFKAAEKTLDGKELIEMSDKELLRLADEVNIYTRMFPEAKLRIINILKQKGHVVAMTGDGVNDSLALKSSHIGIAMGKRGSEVARQAASLILIDDDLSHMVEAIAIGRRIYENLKKAIQYIISIHIPIILIVTIPLLLFWKYTNIFSPVHVIFLELIMGPTCSIIFENEPIEANSMNKPPRKLSSTFFAFNELSISIIQGIIITASCLGMGYYYMANEYSIAEVRTIIYSTLIFSNIFLTLTNRSFYYSVFTTIRYKNPLIPLILGVSLLILLLSIYYSPIRNIFEFVPLPLTELSYCLFAAFTGVMWVEIFKFIKRRIQSV